MKNSSWKIEYNNDTGANDEGFWEEWNVTDGNRSFFCRAEADAKWLLSKLNKKPVTQGRPKKIDVGVWEFRGFTIEAQNHPKLKPYVVRVIEDVSKKYSPQGFYTFKECLQWIKLNQQ